MKVWVVSRWPDYEFEGVYLTRDRAVEGLAQGRTVTIESEDDGDLFLRAGASTYDVSRVPVIE